MRKSNIDKDKRGIYYYQTWSYYNTSGDKKKQVRKYIGKKTPKEFYKRNGINTLMT